MVTIYRVIPELSLTIMNLAHIEESFRCIYSGGSRLHLLLRRMRNFGNLRVCSEKHGWPLVVKVGKHLQRCVIAPIVTRFAEIVRGAYDILVHFPS